RVDRERAEHQEPDEQRSDDHHRPQELEHVERREPVLVAHYIDGTAEPQRRATFRVAFGNERRPRVTFFQRLSVVLPLLRARAWGTRVYSSPASSSRSPRASRLTWVAAAATTVRMRPARTRRRSARARARSRTGPMLA